MHPSHGQGNSQNQQKTPFSREDSTFYSRLLNATQNFRSANTGNSPRDLQNREYLATQVSSSNVPSNEEGINQTNAMFQTKTGYQPNQFNNSNNKSNPPRDGFVATQHFDDLREEIAEFVGLVESKHSKPIERHLFAPPNYSQTSDRSVPNTTHIGINQYSNTNATRRCSQSNHPQISAGSQQSNDGSSSFTIHYGRNQYKRTNATQRCSTSDYPQTSRCSPQTEEQSTQYTNRVGNDQYNHTNTTHKFSLSNNPQTGAYISQLKEQSTPNINHVGIDQYGHTNTTQSSPLNQSQPRSRSVPKIIINTTHIYVNQNNPTSAEPRNFPANDLQTNAGSIQNTIGIGSDHHNTEPRYSFSSCTSFTGNPTQNSVQTAVQCNMPDTNQIGRNPNHLTNATSSSVPNMRQTTTSISVVQCDTAQPSPVPTISPIVYFEHVAHKNNQPSASTSKPAFTQEFYDFIKSPQIQQIPEDREEPQSPGFWVCDPELWRKEQERINASSRDKQKQLPGKDSLGSGKKLATNKRDESHGQASSSATIQRNEQTLGSHKKLKKSRNSEKIRKKTAKQINEKLNRRNKILEDSSFFSPKELREMNQEMIKGSKSRKIVSEQKSSPIAKDHKQSNIRDSDIIVIDSSTDDDTKSDDNQTKGTSVDVIHSKKNETCHITETISNTNFGSNQTPGSSTLVVSNEAFDHTLTQKNDSSHTPVTHLYTNDNPDPIPSLNEWLQSTQKSNSSPGSASNMGSDVGVSNGGSPYEQSSSSNSASMDRFGPEERSTNSSIIENERIDNDMPKIVSCYSLNPEVNATQGRFNHNIGKIPSLEPDNHAKTVCNSPPAAFHKKITGPPRSRKTRKHRHKKEKSKKNEVPVEYTRIIIPSKTKSATSTDMSFDKFILKKIRCNKSSFDNANATISGNSDLPLERANVEILKKPRSPKLQRENMSEVLPIKVCSLSSTNEETRETSTTTPAPGKSYFERIEELLEKSTHSNHMSTSSKSDQNVYTTSEITIQDTTRSMSPKACVPPLSTPDDNRMYAGGETKTRLPQNGQSYQTPNTSVIVSPIQPNQLEACTRSTFNIVSGGEETNRNEKSKLDSNVGKSSGLNEDIDPDQTLQPKSYSSSNSNRSNTIRENIKPSSTDRFNQSNTVAIKNSIGSNTVGSIEAINPGIHISLHTSDCKIHKEHTAEGNSQSKLLTTKRKFCSNDDENLDQIIDYSMKKPRPSPQAKTTDKIQNIDNSVPMDLTLPKRTSNIMKADITTSKPIVSVGTAILQICSRTGFDSTTVKQGSDLTLIGSKFHENATNAKAVDGESDREETISTIDKVFVSAETSSLFQKVQQMSDKEVENSVSITSNKTISETKYSGVHAKEASSGTNQATFRKPESENVKNVLEADMGKAHKTTANNTHVIVRYDESTSKEQPMEEQSMIPSDEHVIHTDNEDKWRAGSSPKCVIQVTDESPKLRNIPTPNRSLNKEDIGVSMDSSEEHPDKSPPKNVIIIADKSPTVLSKFPDDHSYSKKKPDALIPNTGDDCQAESLPKCDILVADESLGISVEKYDQVHDNIHDVQVIHESSLLKCDIFVDNASHTAEQLNLGSNINTDEDNSMSMTSTETHSSSSECDISLEEIQSPTVASITDTLSHKNKVCNVNVDIPSIITKSIESRTDINTGNVESEEILEETKLTSLARDLSVDKSPPVEIQSKFNALDTFALEPNATSSTCDIFVESSPSTNSDSDEINLPGSNGLYNCESERENEAPKKSSDEMIKPSSVTIDKCENNCGISLLQDNDTNRCEIELQNTLRDEKGSLTVVVVNDQGVESTRMEVELEPNEFQNPQDLGDVNRNVHKYSDSHDKVENSDSDSEENQSHETNKALSISECIANNENIDSISDSTEQDTFEEDGFKVITLTENSITTPTTQVEIYLDVNDGIIYAPTSTPTFSDLDKTLHAKPENQAITETATKTGSEDEYTKKRSEHDSQSVSDSVQAIQYHDPQIAQTDQDDISVNSVSNEILSLDSEDSSHILRDLGRILTEAVVIEADVSPTDEEFANPSVQIVSTETMSNKDSRYIFENRISSTPVVIKEDLSLMDEDFEQKSKDLGRIQSGVGVIKEKLSSEEEDSEIVSEIIVDKGIRQSRSSTSEDSRRVSREYSVICKNLLNENQKSKESGDIYKNEGKHQSDNEAVEIHRNNLANSNTPWNNDHDYAKLSVIRHAPAAVKEHDPLYLDGHVETISLLTSSEDEVEIAPKIDLNKRSKVFLKRNIAKCRKKGAVGPKKKKARLGNWKPAQLQTLPKIAHQPALYYKTAQKTKVGSDIPLIDVLLGMGVVFEEQSKDHELTILPNESSKDGHKDNDILQKFGIKPCSVVLRRPTLLSAQSLLNKKEQKVYQNYHKGFCW